MQKTTNLNLNKPDLTDFYDVGDFNENADIIDAAVADKVDKVTGKGLSTNDYTNADKAAVDTISDKVDKVTGKGLSTNDYTTAEKQKLAKSVISITSNNISVAPTDFVSDSTYANYPLKVEIAMSGVTSDYIPTVNLDVEQATSGNFAPVANAITDKVVIYAKAAADATFVIPSIICVKGGA